MRLLLALTCTPLLHFHAFACLLFQGYIGERCETQTATTTKPLKCSDCKSAGTEYCISVNSVLECKCKTGTNKFSNGCAFHCLEMTSSGTKNQTYNLPFPGYSGQKCDVFSSTTVAPLKCSDCSSVGTQYCTSNNGVFQCVCKTG